MISPVLFCVYVDGLLKLLSDVNIGCYIGHVFVLALVYADDIVLLAPTARATRKLLSLCDEFASGFYVLFNAKSRNVCISGLRKLKSLIAVLSQCLISVATLLNLFGSGYISVI